MNDTINKQFADVIIKLNPEIQMNVEEIQESLKTRELVGFIQSSDEKTAELAEIAELISRMDKRGDQDG